MDIQNYLQRIHFRHVPTPSLEVLNDLHLLHQYHVPFENVDVHRNVRFDLELDKIYSKVVLGRRGGFCYELNLLFHSLLTRIGFDSRLIASRIVEEDGTLGPPLDHLCLLVQLDQPYLADVGYGDLYRTPLRVAPGVQRDGMHFFGLEVLGNDEWRLSMSYDGSEFKPRYQLNLAPVQPEDFDAICLEKQTSPDSYFVKNLVCTVPTPTGRKTIFNQQWIVTEGKEKVVTSIENENALNQLLQEQFGIH